MRPQRPKFKRPPQPVPEELCASILELLRAKFYDGPDRAAEAKAFAQDRTRLLKWVVLWPAWWLNSRAVTIHGDEYRKIFVKTFLQAAAHVTSKVKYRPAYLRHVIQSHFAHHGEEYYDQAKALRAQVDHILLIAQQGREAAPDPVAALAAAQKLLAVPKRAKKAEKPLPATPKPALQPPVKDQLSLF